MQIVIAATISPSGLATNYAADDDTTLSNSLHRIMFNWTRSLSNASLYISLQRSSYNWNQWATQQSGTGVVKNEKSL